MTDSATCPPPGYNSSTRPSTHEPAQKEHDEEARFMSMMEEMTERVTFRVTARLLEEVACLARELATTNTAIEKISG